MKKRSRLVAAPSAAGGHCPLCKGRVQIIPGFRWKKYKLYFELSNRRAHRVQTSTLLKSLIPRTRTTYPNPVSKSLSPLVSKSFFNTTASLRPLRQAQGWLRPAKHDHFPAAGYLLPDFSLSHLK